MRGESGEAPRSPGVRPRSAGTGAGRVRDNAAITDLARWNHDELGAIAAALNSHPRKTLGWKTPAEALSEQLRSLQPTGVATTG